MPDSPPDTDHDAELAPASGRAVPLAGALFDEVATITVDPGYIAAAARRAERGEPPATRRGQVTLAVTFASVGLLIAAAATQTRAGAPAAKRLRAQLVEEADRRTAETDVLQRAAELLRADTVAARDRGLRVSELGDQLADELAVLEALVGELPARGPGIEVTLADSPTAGSQDDPQENGRVRDRDVQEVVNALWAAGAEAIAVNGQRISALTAIREAGQVILVDYKPVTGPYVVAAVGDAEDLQVTFAASSTFRTFRSWSDVYGMGFGVKRRGKIDLPAAVPAQLRHAHPAGSTP